MALLQQLALVVEGLGPSIGGAASLAFVFALGFGSGSATGFILGFLFSAVQQRGD